MVEQIGRPRVTTLISVALVFLACTEAAAITVFAIPLSHLLPLSDRDYRVFNIVTAVVFSVAGFAIIRRQPKNPIGWLFIAGAVGNGLYGTALSLVLYEVGVRHVPFPADTVLALTAGAWMPLPASLAFTLALFPNGAPVTPRWRPILYVLGGGFVLWSIGALISQPDTSAAPPPLIGMRNPFASPIGNDVANAGLALVVLGAAGAVVSLFVRVRRARGIERQQLKWLAIAAVPIFISFANFFIGATVFVSAVAVGLLVIPVSVAILGYRLYDLDLFVNRALVYMFLSAIVVGIYVGIVGLTALLASGSHFGVLPVVAAVVAALIALPLREQMQTGVDRLLYGHRREPLKVVTALGRQLEASGPPDDALQTAIADLMDVLRLDGLQVSVAGGDPIASAGSVGEAAVRTPLVHQGETVGELAAAARPGESLSPRDLSLLHDLGPQLAIAVHASQLTDELRRSRERLVLTREEERRRIRRDLHDSLGPTLSGIAMEVDAALNLIENDPRTVANLLTQVRSELTSAISEIRKLVYGLRPSALDEVGLVGALCQQAERLGVGDGSGLRIEVAASTDMHDLPAAVEVAAYRIAAEAMNNVARHAEAAHCRVELRAADDLEVEIVDDGRGWSTDSRSGVGLNSMRERAEELGGRLLLGVAPSGGSRILATLPLRGRT